MATRPSIEQVRFVDLLEIPAFRKFLLTRPDVPINLFADGRKPWRVYVQMEHGGKWAKKDFRSYKDALRLIVTMRRRGAHDLALCCRSKSFDPPGRWVKLTKRGRPVWAIDAQTKKPRVGVQQQRWVEVKAPPGHEWCRYCRRWTVFSWFTRHHAFPDGNFDKTVLRCTICGISEGGNRK